MHPADMIILAALSLSLIFGFMRGLVREAFALAGWVLAIVVARWFNAPLSAEMAPWVNTPSLRLIFSWGFLFLATLVTCNLLGQAFRLAVRAGGLSLSDRMLGGVFGVVRGGLLVLIALMLMAPYVKHDAWFRDAQLPRAILAYESLARSLERSAVTLIHIDKPGALSAPRHP